MGGFFFGGCCNTKESVFKKFLKKTLKKKQIFGVKNEFERIYCQKRMDNFFYMKGSKFLRKVVPF